MNSADLLTAVRRTLGQLAAFNEIARALTSTLDVSEVLRLVMAKVSELLQPQSWSLLLLDDTEQLYFEICVGPAADKLKHLKVSTTEGIAGSVFRNQKPRLVRDVLKDPDFASRFDTQAAFNTRSLIAVPLVAKGRSLGVIEIVNGDGAREFTDDDMMAVSAIADYAAIAIENARVFRQVQELTVIDEHTGLYNVRALSAHLEREVARAARFARSFALLFLDLDDFKQVNDTHGHLVGSATLKAVGQLLQASIRGVDSAYRYGGDEFAVLLLETDAVGARATAERILQGFKTLTLDVPGVNVRLGASIGAATFPDVASSPTALIAAADRAMYQAKRQGKGRLVLAPVTSPTSG